MATKHHPGTDWMNTLTSIVRDDMAVVDNLYDRYFDQNPEWSEEESNLYHKIDDLVDDLARASAKYAQFLCQHTRP